MTRSEFARIFGLLESAFGEQKPERRDFYFRQFEHTELWAFTRAARRIVETRDDGFGFPLIAEISKAIEEIQRERPTADEADMEARGYCQRCGNVGFYLNVQGGASLCSCRVGRLKEARMKLGLSARRSEVEELAKKLSPPEPPVRGLQEKNPAGFWEDIQEEHDRWCAAKRAEIEEIKARQAKEPQKPSAPSDELRFKEIQSTVSRIKFQDQHPESAEREPGLDEEEDEVGF
jgi:hypothetical protein